MCMFGVNIISYGNEDSFLVENTILIRIVLNASGDWKTVKVMDLQRRKVYEDIGRTIIQLIDGCYTITDGGITNLTRRR